MMAQKDELLASSVTRSRTAVRANVGVMVAVFLTATCAEKYDPRVTQLIVNVRAACGDAGAASALLELNGANRQRDIDRRPEEPRRGLLVLDLDRIRKQFSEQQLECFAQHDDQVAALALADGAAQGLYGAPNYSRAEKILRASLIGRTAPLDDECVFSQRDIYYACPSGLAQSWALLAVLLTSHQPTNERTAEAVKLIDRAKAIARVAIISEDIPVAAAAKAEEQK